jgi:polar amino acid transport system substrate-binding protein
MEPKRGGLASGLSRLLNRRLAGLAMALLLLNAATADAEPIGRAPDDHLTLLTEENPPFNHLDPETGQAAGYGSAIVRTIMERAGIPYTIEFGPWSRMIAAARTQRNHCAFSMNLTPERRDQFKWVGPFLKTSWGFFGHAGRAMPDLDLDGVRQYRVAVQRDGSMQKLLTDRGGYTVEPTTFVTAFRMLKGGRVDLVASGDLNALFHAATADVAVEMKLPMGHTLQALGCSLNTDDAVMNRLVSAFAEMRRDGTLSRLAPAAALPPEPAEPTE